MRYEPEAGATSVVDLLVNLDHVSVLLRPLATKTDDQLTIEDSALLAQAHLMLAGSRLPCARGYGVVKHYNPANAPSSGLSRPVLWPDMLFTRRRVARQWADFLGDYYNTWGDEFKVELAWGPPEWLDAKAGVPVGSGYLPGDHDRRKPMERWTWDMRTLQWSRTLEASA